MGNEVNIRHNWDLQQRELREMESIDRQLQELKQRRSESVDKIISLGKIIPIGYKPNSESVQQGNASNEDERAGE